MSKSIEGLYTGTSTGVYMFIEQHLVLLNSGTWIVVLANYREFVTYHG